MTRRGPDTPDDLDPAPRFPPLAWRKPAPAWIAGAAVISIAPVPALGLGLGLSLLTAACVALTIALAVTLVWAASSANRPARARREVVMAALASALPLAILAPGIAGFFSGAELTPGYQPAMGQGLWPLGLMLGLPLALLAGLACAGLVFEKPPVREPEPERGDALPEG